MPAAVVLHFVVALAERGEVLEGGVAAVLPRDRVVDLAPGCRHPASGTHAPVGPPLRQAPQRRRRRVLAASDREHHARLGMREHPHPHRVASAQFARPADRDRPDTFHCRRVGSRRGNRPVVGFEQGKGRHGDHDGGADAARFGGMRRRGPFDEQVGHHVGADLVEGAGLTLVREDRLRDRRRPTVRRGRFNLGPEMVCPRHPIAHRLDVHPAVRQRSLVALREGHDACVLDQLSQRATEFTHRLRSRPTRGLRPAGHCAGQARAHRDRRPGSRRAAR